MTDKSELIGWIIISTAVGTVVGMIVRGLVDKYIFQKLGIQTGRKVRY